MAYDVTLVQIRERSFLDVLDLALVVVRRKPAALGVAALCGCAPFAALNAYLASTLELMGVVYLPLLFLEAPWATAPLTVVLGGLMFDERPRLGRVANGVVRGFFRMLVFQGILRWLLMTLVLTLPVIPWRLAFLNEVILLERCKWREVFRRTGDLCGDRGGELLARAIVQLLFGALFVVCFWWAVARATDVLFSGWSWESFDWPSMLDWRTQLGVWLAISFFAVVKFLTYIDQRIRIEGWEVELRLRQTGSALEDRERW